MAEIKTEADSFTMVDGYLKVTLKAGKGVKSTTGKSLVCGSTGGFRKIEGTDYAVNVVLIKRV